MEKRTILAILISIAFIVAWEKWVIRRYYPQPDPEKQTVTQAQPSSMESVEGERGLDIVTETPKPEILQTETTLAESDVNVDEEGLQSSPEVAMERTVVLENDHLRITLTNRGGAVESVLLKGYEDEDGSMVELVNPYAADAGMMPLSTWKNDSLDRRLFHVEQTENRVRFYLGDEEKILELKSGFQLHASVTGMAGSWVSLGAGIERAERSSSRYSTEDTVVLSVEGEVDRIKKKNLGEEDIPRDKLDWVAIEDKYFARIAAPTEGWRSLRGGTRSYTSNGDEFLLATMLIDMADEWQGNLYFGPKHFDDLKALGLGYEKIVNFGFFGIFAKWMFLALKTMNKWVGNFGWSIVLLTILIRIFLFPLNQASLKSTKKMQAIQPKIKEIQAKYKKYGNDMSMKQKQNQEIAALYKEEGVNPLGGCLPMLLQMPIFFAFWSLLLNAIELRHAPFLGWIQDLSTHDPYFVLPIMMGLTQLISQVITPATGDPNQKRMMYLLPVVFTVILAYAPSGLILYWTTNNIFQILQQLLLNRKMPAAA